MSSKQNKQWHINNGGFRGGLSSGPTCFWRSKGDSGFQNCELGEGGA